jgi:hypothetical protein
MLVLPKALQKDWSCSSEQTPCSGAKRVDQCVQCDDGQLTRHVKKNCAGAAGIGVQLRERPKPRCTLGDCSNADRGCVDQWNRNTADLLAHTI